MSDSWLVQPIICHPARWAFGTLMYVQPAQISLGHWVLTGIVPETKRIFHWRCTILGDLRAETW